jgi:predicted deacylase
VPFNIARLPDALLRGVGYGLLAALFTVGCATAPPLTPTVAPTVTPPPSLNRPVTTTPRPVVAIPTISPTPTAIPPTPAAIAFTALPTTQRTAAPVLRAANLTRIGVSVEGREIVAQRYGSGGRVVLLVGGIHGGWEANTVTLMNDLAAHYAANPADILPSLAVEIIPVMNPDGLPRGRVPAGRFNARSVDLNRNWACGWSSQAYWRTQTVDAGSAPFSEPETQAVAAYIEALRPAVVLFYHSAADGIFAGDCAYRPTGNISDVMSAVYGQAAGYSYGAAFSAYPVTGTAASWVDGLGIPSADVELSSTTSPQTAQNLRGVQAVQCWLVGYAAAGCAG